jgi:hypothetical protein
MGRNVAVSDSTFEAARYSNRQLLSQTESIEIPIVREAADSFVQNLNRAFGHCDLPMALFDSVWMRGSSAGLIKRRPRNRPGAKTEWADDTDRIAEFLPQIKKVLVECGVIADGDKLDRWLDSMLESMIVGLWTAFEILATDLWVKAVNLRPMTLGVNALLAPSNDEQDDSKANTGRAINFSPMNDNILKQYKFELSHSLGTMIRDKRKFKFNSLSGIQWAYQNTFCMRHKDGARQAAPAQVKMWFSGEAFKELNILSATRHVLVHNGGRADEGFLERVGSHPLFSALAKRDQVRVSGIFVRDCANVAMRRGMVLLDGVDKWLMKPE